MLYSFLQSVILLATTFFLILELIIQMFTVRNTLGANNTRTYPFIRNIDESSFFLLLF